MTCSASQQGLLSYSRDRSIFITILQYHGWLCSGGSRKFWWGGIWSQNLKNSDVFTKIETDFLAEIGNSNVFFAQNQVVSKKKKKKKKKKKVFTKIKTDFSAGFVTFRSVGGDASRNGAELFKIRADFSAKIVTFRLVGGDASPPSPPLNPPLWLCYLLYSIRINRNSIQLYICSQFASGSQSPISQQSGPQQKKFSDPCSRVSRKHLTFSSVVGGFCNTIDFAFSPRLILNQRQILDTKIYPVLQRQCSICVLLTGPFTIESFSVLLMTWIFRARSKIKAVGFFFGFSFEEYQKTAFAVWGLKSHNPSWNTALNFKKDLRCLGPQKSQSILKYSIKLQKRSSLLGGPNLSEFAPKSLGSEQVPSLLSAQSTIVT